MLKPCRHVAIKQTRSFFFSPERPITASSSEQGGTNSQPGNTAPSYLGYLQGAITYLMPKTAFGFGATTTEESAKKVENAIAKNKSDKILERKISRSQVTVKTEALVKRVLIAEGAQSQLIRIQDLSEQILRFPATRVVAAQHGELVALLLHLLNSLGSSSKLVGEARKCLSLCGLQPHVKSRGINLLTIDGGGTRGMMGLAILEEIERISGQKVCQLFDHIVGVSTGGIIAALLGVKRYSVDEARSTYMDISRKLFSQTRFKGGLGLIKSHSYYDTSKWVGILKELIGEHEILIESSGRNDVPRLSVIASIVNMPHLEPYIFRNYEPPAGRDSHYRGGAHHEFWKAVQASAAAPMYFEEVQIDDIVLQDGGVIANNPTAIGIHEAKLIWPQEKLHCVVSLGNGRSVVELEPAPVFKSSGLNHKLSRIIDSATDTEAVHMTVNDLLDQKVYYRLNPYMTYNYGLDEIDKERLEQMNNDAVLYVRRNRTKIETVARRLLEEPTFYQRTCRSWESYRNLQGYYKPK